MLPAAKNCAYGIPETEHNQRSLAPRTERALTNVVDNVLRTVNATCLHVKTQVVIRELDPRSFETPELNYITARWRISAIVSVPKVPIGLHQVVS